MNTDTVIIVKQPHFIKNGQVRTQRSSSGSRNLPGWAGGGGNDSLNLRHGMAAIIVVTSYNKVGGGPPGLWAPGSLDRYCTGPTIPISRC